MEQRKARRFDIKLPVRIVRNGVRPFAGAGQTRNLSSAGVLFASDSKIEVGEPIEYVISLLQNGGSPQPVDLHCLGKVMRSDEALPERPDASLPFEVAATLERYEFVRSQRA